MWLQVVKEIIKHLHAGQIQLGVNKQSGLVIKNNLKRLSHKIEFLYKNR